MSFDSRSKGTFLERLNAGPVIGDGGFVFALEKRGVVKAGPWTPEAVIEHPEAVRQLHKEFIRAGSDVCQAFTYYGSEDKLNNRGNQAGQYGVYKVNAAACDIVGSVAKPAGCLIAGGVGQIPAYLTTRDKEKVKAEVAKQLEVFKDFKVDLMISETCETVEEVEWHVEAIKEFMPGTPICASLCINEYTDIQGVPTGECGVRLVKAGADVVGVNCYFDPSRSINAVKKMISAVKDAGLKAHYMTQPLAMWTPDAGVQGFIDLPEFPLAFEPRTLTRFEAGRYAREAFEAGIMFIGGCCGFESYHIRAMSEELTTERGGYLPANCTNWGKALELNTKPWVRVRAKREYWENLKPATGRIYSPTMSKPDDWGVLPGDELAKQMTAATVQEELEDSIKRFIA